nr:unnamed protein product [Callosobruchus analis]
MNDWQKKFADSNRLSFLLAGKLSNNRCYERFTSIQCGKTPLNHVAGWFEGNSREKPILKPSFVNGNCLLLTISKNLEEKANSEPRTDALIIDANDITKAKVSDDFDLASSDKESSDEPFND